MSAYRDPIARPGVLICAGLDPSGGAGIIADVRVAADLGTRPVGVITATTVQNTTAVLGAEPTRPDALREQLEFLLSDVEVKAVKIGMLGSSENAISIGAALALTGAPVVWDPITYPSRGDVSFVDSLFGKAVQALMPHVTLLTPNAKELGFLVGYRIDGMPEAIAAGLALVAKLDVAVLVKAGHLGTADAVDVLCMRGNMVRLEGKRTPRGEDVHGTGCALSTAIAAHLANGVELVDACRQAKAYVAERIERPVHPGRGAAAVV
jgi:hydroxymethylpyrimidine/phosphomethylpyrimidine kinase